MLVGGAAKSAGRIAAHLNKVAGFGLRREGLCSLENLWGAAKSVGYRRPLLLASGILTTKGVLCDVIGQRAVEGRAFPEEWDKTRTAILSLYGGICEAPIAYYVYSVVFPRLWPGATTLSSLWKMVLVDNLFVWPLLIYPTFYLMNGVILDKESPEAILRKYQRDFVEVNSVSAAVWAPANTVNFLFTPQRFRAAVMAVVAFFYTTFWSVQQAQLREAAGSAVMQPPRHASAHSRYCLELCSGEMVSQLRAQTGSPVDGFARTCNRVCKVSQHSFDA